MNIEIKGQALFELMKNAEKAKNWELLGIIKANISSQAPGLFRLVFEDSFKPYGCSGCPFAKEPRDVNNAVPDEGYYFCALKKVDGVWGENPVCEDKDWMELGQKELLNLLG